MTESKYGTSFFKNYLMNGGPPLKWKYDDVDIRDQLEGQTLADICGGDEIFEITYAHALFDIFGINEEFLSQLEKQLDSKKETYAKYYENKIKEILCQRGDCPPTPEDITSADKQISTIQAILNQIRHLYHAGYWVDAHWNDPVGPSGQLQIACSPAVWTKAEIKAACSKHWWILEQWSSEENLQKPFKDGNGVLWGPHQFDITSAKKISEIIRSRFPCTIKNANEQKAAWAAIK
jgi:hypothetical protein